MKRPSIVSSNLKLLILDGQRYILALEMLKSVSSVLVHVPYLTLLDWKMRRGIGQGLVPRAPHAKNQAANPSVSELIGAITGFCCENDAR